ncbi:MAG: prepilin-type N-terminal cleavage/methylation domain-containing protein [Actinomycetes bacterium]
MRRHRSKHLDQGFTLVEMLVVLMIMGILAGVTYVGLTSSRTNSVQNSCKTAYQSIALAVSAFQSDNANLLPTSITGLQPTYLNAGLVNSYANNFSLQLGVYAVKSASLTGKVATITFASTYLPPITVGESIQVSGIDALTGQTSAFDGSWTVGTFTGAASPYTVTYNVTSTNTVSNTAISASSAILNVLSSSTAAFDVYLYNSTLTKRIGTTTAPTACGSLS